MEQNGGQFEKLADVALQELRRVFDKKFLTPGGCFYSLPGGRAWPPGPLPCD